MKRKKQILMIILGVAIANLGFLPGLAVEKNGDLSVNVIGLRSSNGLVRIAISNSKENYETKGAEPFRRTIVDIQKGKAKTVFKDLPLGEYAVKLIHDENGNGKHVSLGSQQDEPSNREFQRTYSAACSHCAWED